MNKRILTVAVAALALSACSKNETVEVAGNQAIEFGTFVNNNTRAIIDDGSLETFYVFGGYQAVPDAFDNTPVGVDGQTQVLWTANSYKFAAYSDGNAKFAATHSFEDNTLTFTGYEAGTNDLVAAVNTYDNSEWDETSDIAAVGLNFKHLLTKIKFTFTTDAAESYTMAVSNIRIANAVKTGTATYNGGESTAWTGNADGTYEIADIADIATADPNVAVSTDEYFVIPQNNASLQVTFDVTVTSDDESIEPLTNSFTGSLAVTDASNLWVSGFAYNYTAHIELKDVDGSVKYIEFTPTVDPWEEEADVPVME